MTGNRRASQDVISELDYEMPAMRKLIERPSDGYRGSVIRGLPHSGIWRTGREAAGGETKIVNV